MRQARLTPRHLEDRGSFAEGGGWLLRGALNACRTISPRPWAWHLSLPLTGGVTSRESWNHSEPPDFHLTNEDNEAGLPCRSVRRVVRVLQELPSSHLHLHPYKVLGFIWGQWRPVKGFLPGAGRLG